MRRVVPLLALVLSSCGKDEMSLSNQLDNAVSIEVRAPRATLRGGCSLDFAERFCREEFEVIGVIDLTGRQSRVLALAEDVNDEQCTNQLWLRLIRLDDIGPVDDRGTTFLLPNAAEIEEGAGAIHGVAFPQKTVRLDEVGLEDAKQSGPPRLCSELGRLPR